MRSIRIFLNIPQETCLDLLHPCVGAGSYGWFHRLAVWRLIFCPCSFNLNAQLLQSKYSAENIFFSQTSVLLFMFFTNYLLACWWIFSFCKQRSTLSLIAGWLLVTKRRPGKEVIHKVLKSSTCLCGCLTGRSLLLAGGEKDSRQWWERG